MEKVHKLIAEFQTKYFQYALQSIAWVDDHTINFMLQKDPLFQNNSRIK